MELKYFDNISEFLGKEEERYFSNGFKYIDFEYENTAYENKLFTGEITANYQWENKKNRHLHLGTTEFIAIASVICEQILFAEFGLAPEEVASSWISSFKIKVRASVNLAGDTKVQISGELKSTEKIDSLNKYKSSFEIRVDTVIIRISVTHSVNALTVSQSNACAGVDKSGLYCFGYKNRRHIIEKLTLDDESNICKASVSIEDFCSRKSGIGSRYDGTLVTDIVLISGQLAQTLFCHVEKIDRSTGNNIWLKEFEAFIDKPNEEKEYGAKLVFTDIKTLEKENETWRSVQIFCELGEVYLNAKIVSQIK